MVLRVLCTLAAIPLHDRSLALALATALEQMFRASPTVEIEFAARTSAPSLPPSADMTCPKASAELKYDTMLCN